MILWCKLSALICNYLQKGRVHIQILNNVALISISYSLVGAFHILYSGKMQVATWLEAAVRICAPWSPAPQGWCVAMTTCVSALCMGNALCYWKKMVTLGLRSVLAVRLPLISCSMYSSMANDVEFAGFVWIISLYIHNTLLFSYQPWRYFS